MFREMVFGEPTGSGTGFHSDIGQLRKFLQVINISYLLDGVRKGDQVKYKYLFG